MRKNHSKIVCIKLVHLPYLELRNFVNIILETFVFTENCQVVMLFEMACVCL